MAHSARTGTLISAIAATSGHALGGTLHVDVAPTSGHQRQVETLAAMFSWVASGLTVTFTDESTGNPTQWDWDFDGDPSVEQNPVYAFGAPGLYGVTLTVSDGATSDSHFLVIEVTA